MKESVYVVMAYTDEGLYYNEGYCVGIARTTEGTNRIIKQDKEKGYNSKYVISVYEIQD